MGKIAPVPRIVIGLAFGFAACKKESAAGVRRTLSSSEAP
jgi:hypothetical protein